MTADAGAQMRKGVVEYCVLGLLAREPMYGWQLADALTGAGLIASIGTLYPLLARLRDSGWVVTFDQPSGSGPVRRYYRLTDAGATQLVRFRAQWQPFARIVGDLVGADPAVESGGDDAGGWPAADDADDRADRAERQGSARDATDHETAGADTAREEKP